MIEERSLGQMSVLLTRVWIYVRVFCLTGKTEKYLPQNNVPKYKSGGISLMI